MIFCSTRNKIHGKTEVIYNTQLYFPLPVHKRYLIDKYIRRRCCRTFGLKISSFIL